MAASNASPDPAALPMERELVITRIFDAPRELVFRAWTDPDDDCVYFPFFRRGRLSLRGDKLLAAKQIFPVAIIFPLGYHSSSRCEATLALAYL